MEGDVSMTLGYVLKCNYNLPYNASDYKRDYVRREEEILSQEMSKAAKDKARKHGKLATGRNVNYSTSHYLSLDNQRHN